MKKLVVIDASAVLHRAWHALPKLTDPKGRIINATYGFTVLLLKLLKEQNPDYIAVAFDTRAPTFRHKKYKQYKAKRIPQPQEFYDQIPITKKIIKTFNIPGFEKRGYEADDIIGTIIHCKEKKIKGLKSIIVTGDLDLLQLVNNNTHVYFLKHGVTHIKEYNNNAVYKRYELKPNNLIDFKALCGDPSDNIKGVKGIGPTTAKDLIKKYKNIENIYKDLEKCLENKCKIKQSTASLLIKNKKSAFLSKELVSIKQDIKGLDLKKIKTKKIEWKKVINMFNDLGFKSLIKRLEKTNINQQNKLF